MDKLIEQGAYSRKQIGSRSRLISWSHSTRFQVGLELGRELGGRRVLDYGCGDGTFLAQLMDGPSAPSRAVGAEIADDLVNGNRARFSGRRFLQFVHARELSKDEHTGVYDALVCMEVLEHVLDVDWFLDEFRRLLSPGGLLLLSVPVEIGLSVVIKQATRRINGWRGIGDYPGTTSYGWGELAKAVFAGASQHVKRPVLRNPDGSEFHDHKGFNWQLAREKIRARFELEATRSSPVSWLPPSVASQVWFKAWRRG